jgi:hypothetical protein
MDVVPDISAEGQMREWTQKTMPNQVTAANAGGRTQFRFAGSVFWPGVCEFTSEVIRQEVF